MAKKILVVDDSEVLRKIMEFNLKRAGFEVIQATNGLEGLEVIEKEKPDLVFLDIMMPKMDGFTVLKHLKERNMLNIPIVVVTAKGGEDDAEQATKLGATAVITKPFSPKKLIEIATELTGR
ncbi:MAG: two-component system, OmpR family, alkaline phosphatase synthesis response regulator PhoP [Thermotogota bacterium]|nr:two-component system, OmpR family, alkaline phosphatase synthesis response regulator PhoP [Thermotogota bacterium]MDK2863936.1 two-component system, OmpR family, alkaline phosphatase synthesis response regulator PhoP [Thermotogota bacterium]HCZ05805.1 two-component system response regulator [Thermotogota bacterium]